MSSFQSVSVELRNAPTLSIVKYATDYVLLAATAIVAANLSKFTPNIRPFSLTDLSISLPFTEHPKIPSILLVSLSCFFPAAVVIIVSFLSKGAITRKLWTLNCGLLGLGMSIATTMFFTDGIKNLIGRPRPDLISRCKPDTSRIAEFTRGAAVGGSALVDWGVCTSIDLKELRDGWRSFPSGHASMSFAGLTYLTLFLAAHFSIATQLRRGSRGHVFQLIPTVFPVFLATYIASTRISDFRHHPFDVLFGSALGITDAILSYRFYHPWITASNAGIPWPPAHAAQAVSANESRSVVGGMRREDLEMGKLRDSASVEATTRPDGNTRGESSRYLMHQDSTFL